MASGTGSNSVYANHFIAEGFGNAIEKGKLYNSTGAVLMSDTVVFTWVDCDEVDEFVELNVSGGVKVFTILQEGTVNQLKLYDGYDVLHATIDLTPVVYETPTYYTLPELIIYVSTQYGE